VLRHLEQYWADPRPGEDTPGPALRLAACADPQAEVTLAAREILRHVRAGGRFREVSVLVRKLEGYHDLFHRVFSRYEIPFFLDRRESVAHHPLAELTRGALRTAAFQWQHEDWFAALKTGLVPVSDEDVDRLENEALARGWRGAAWQKPILLPDEPELEHWLAELHRRLLPPFQRLALALATCGNRPTGPQLTSALRDLWRALAVEQKLKGWAEADGSASQPGLSASVHATVWGQLNAWLENVDLAFPEEALSLREWLPILEAGLASLSVGVIPPALDQVLVGAIDRSRNPEIKLALLLGLNEGVFPAPPRAGMLLTENELAELENRNIILGATARQQLARERYLGYIACTRANERLVLTCALSGNDGAVLNPSPFLSQLRRLFPSLECERPAPTPPWQDSEHVHELVAPLLSGARRLGGAGAPPALPELPPALAATIRQLWQLQREAAAETLSPGLAERLYGPVLRTSVSRLEQFAACPFKFFVHSGLRAEERKTFELDAKEQGSFQHEVLAVFHDELRHDHKRWRDITPAEARERIAAIAQRFLTGYRDGLLQATEQSRFLARVLTESLQDFVETLVGWMRGQYLFDPFLVEKPFGQEDAPAWSLALEDGHRIEVQGRIDRIDLFREPGADEAQCVVVDYKSSQKKLDSVLMANGLQLQLPTYLNVLRHWPDPRSVFGVGRLKPAGVFYVNLRGKYERQPNRDEALEDVEQARRAAYRHAGRFDVQALPQLDSRPGVRKGDQFNYTLTLSGEVSKNSREALSSADFTALLDAVEESLRRMGRSIFTGETAVAPYRKGTMTACNLCEYQSICRIDPWTHTFRVLK
jgi:ATP-dependent helicase/nuclease subunit B